MSVINKEQWQPVEIDMEGDFEGLVGFEEITDYDIETFKTASQNEQKLKKKKKKKAVKSKSVFAEEEIQNDVEETDYYPWNNIYVPKEVSRALLEKGFTEPTEIQVLHQLCSMNTVNIFADFNNFYLFC